MNRHIPALKKAESVVQRIAPPPLLQTSTIPIHQYSSAHSNYPRLSLPVVARSSHAPGARSGCWKFNANWTLSTKTSLLKTRTSTSCGSWSTASRTKLPHSCYPVLPGHYCLSTLRRVLIDFALCLSCFPHPIYFTLSDLLVHVRPVHL